MAAEHPAFDLEVRLVGRVFWVPRRLELLRRIEQAFGAVPPLVERLARGAITYPELLRLIGHILADADDRPEHEDLAQWLFDAGLDPVAKSLAMPVYTLVMGNAALAAVERGNAKARGEVPPEDRPFSRPAS